MYTFVYTKEYQSVLSEFIWEIQTHTRITGLLTYFFVEFLYKK